MTKRAAVTAVAPLTATEAKAAAVARVIARRRPPEYATYPDPRGGAPLRVQVDTGGEISGAKDLSEWLDDRVSRCPLGTPLADTLIGVFERLRPGAGTVAEAVAFAAGQVRDPHQQFGLWMVLGNLPGGPGVDALKAALVREWRRQRLADTPQPMVMTEPADWNAPSRASREVRYRTERGNPASLAY